MTAPADTGDYRVDLDIFEGPLDLLLHLIRTEEVDIYDIPISRITDQYLQYLEMMKDLNITVAGEYLVMAATLIHIKSRMLLPPDPVQEGEEEPPDPRQELVDRLLEYERFKKAAGLLHDRQVIEDSIWVRGGNEFEEEEKEAVSATVFDLVKAFHSMVERHKEQVVMEFAHEHVTLEQKLDELRQLIRVKKEILFSSFLENPISRIHLVVTFFALLEMTRLAEVMLFQENLFSDIRIVAC
ncbi:MAG: segregation/condensation protein A [Acidobacteriota bacterium]|nr:MAG: segregation/condensation protein A [Acidobacteriota bacterium]